MDVVGGRVIEPKDTFIGGTFSTIKALYMFVDRINNNNTTLTLLNT